jgi:hypothetical protein
VSVAADTLVENRGNEEREQRWNEVEGLVFESGPVYASLARMERAYRDSVVKVAIGAARLARVVLFSLVGACQAGQPALVDCGSDEDCAPGERCGDEHACVPDADGTPGLLSWGETGLISRIDNPFGIEGTLYAYDDCDDVRAAVSAGSFVCPDPPPTVDCCTVWDAGLAGPLERSPGVEVEAGVPRQTSGRFCAKGVTTRVLPGEDGLPSYWPQWGAGLGINLNDWGPFDATAAFPGGPIRGFSADLEGPPSAQRGVTFGVGVTSSNEKYFKEFPIPTRGATILLSELQQGDWVTPSEPLDPTQLTDVSFGFASTVDGEEPFDLCVTNVRVLQ